MTMVSKLGATDYHEDGGKYIGHFDLAFSRMWYYMPSETGIR
jgi:hypothetical protein